MVSIVDLALTGAVAAICSLLGSLFMWNFVGPRIVDKGVSQRVGPALYTWLMTPSIETGKNRIITDDETGEKTEVKEILSPWESLLKSAGEVVYMRLLGKMGGDRRKVQAVQSDIVDGLANPGSPFATLLNGVNPRLLERALKDGDYVPILLDQFGPLIQKFVEQKLSTQNGVNAQF